MTSHFAGNKVTLYDFQLAEEMNKAFKITQKEFTMHPFTNPKSWSTLRIFTSTFFIGALLFNFGYYFGIDYPTSVQRGEAPQPAMYKPLIVEEYKFNINELQEQKGLDKWAENNVDDFALKTALFRSKGIF